MSTHPVQWQTPQPLWARFQRSIAGALDQARPAIFGFDRDDFMEQMLGTLARDPAKVDQLLARPETWRAPMGAQTDLIERVPLPAIAQTGIRRIAARRAKPIVEATLAEKQVEEQAQSRSVPLKLYQPAHQRFYLVSASLVCAMPGLPERAVVAGGNEQVSCVLRRLLTEPPNSTDQSTLREFAFVMTAQGRSWQRVATESAGQDEGARLAPGEEQLPVFPLAFSDDAQRSRTLWTAMIPVGRREEYAATSVIRSPAASFAQGQRQSVEPGVAAPRAVSTQARLAQFKIDVAEPWKNLIRSAYATSASLTHQIPEFSESESPAATKRRVFDFNLQQQAASWLILLDFADFLFAYLPEVWQAIADGGATAAALSGKRRDLYNWLGNAKMPAALENALLPPGGGGAFKTAAQSLRAALKAVRTDAVRAGLESAINLYVEGTHAEPQWPAFHFVLAGLGTNYLPAGPYQNLNLLDATPAPDSEREPQTESTLSEAQQRSEQLDRLTALVGRSLEPIVETGARPIPFAMQVRDALAANVNDAGWYVVRFVYTRRDCGPLHPPTLSAPTQRFQLANFFDPDAPARPIRITLPLDTSPAALRKYNRNTAFVISDMLCGQIQRAKGLGFIDLVLSVLPWPLHKDLDVGSGGSCRNAGGINIGMICSLSIPIITICALILLIIIVTLLDLIFRWLPFFIFCFPVPFFKGKKGAT
jgi:hypothetical protein